MVRTIIAILVILLAVPPFFFKTHITAPEIRYYVIVFLFLCAAMVFAVLRMYNAVVVNSRFLHQLNKALRVWKTSIDKLNSTLSDAVKKYVNLTKAVTKNTEELGNTRKSKSVQSNGSNQRPN